MKSSSNVSQACYYPQFQFLIQLDNIDFSATLKKKIPRKGTLYLTQGFIYFYAKIFKQVTKVSSNFPSFSLRSTNLIFHQTIIPVSNAIPSVVSESKGKKVEIVTPEKKYSVSLSVFTSRISVMTLTIYYFGFGLLVPFFHRRC